MSTIVVMPGGFHPFHAGHYALYKSAVEAFPDAEVYVAATNAQEERPFPFSIKEKLAKVAGVKPGHFIQVKSPFQPKEITNNFNPEQDVLIFVRSEKDKNESPKPGGTKKDGSPAYFQPYTGKDLVPFGQHAYIAYLPTVKFGPGITSATEIRKAWPNLDERRKTAMVMSLYPAAQKNLKLAKNIVQMMDIGMGGEAVNEARGLAPVSPYVELMQNLGWFVSAQTAKIAQDAVDATAQQELKIMQQQFNKPMLNGKTFADVVGDPSMFKNPKVAAVLLKYAYELLNYIEPRIKKYVRPELQTKWLGELAKLKDKYRAAVQQTSGQLSVEEGIGSRLAAGALAGALTAGAHGVPLTKPIGPDGRGWEHDRAREVSSTIGNAIKDVSNSKLFSTDTDQKAVDVQRERLKQKLKKIEHLDEADYSQDYIDEK